VNLAVEHNPMNGLKGLKDPAQGRRLGGALALVKHRFIGVSQSLLELPLCQSKYMDRII